MGSEMCIRDRPTDRQTDRQTVRQSVSQSVSQTDKQTDRQTVRQTESPPTTQLVVCLAEGVVTGADGVLTSRTSHTRSITDTAPRIIPRNF